MSTFAVYGPFYQGRPPTEERMKAHMQRDEVIE
jgi:hypothetical protein